MIIFKEIKISINAEKVHIVFQLLILEDLARVRLMLSKLTISPKNIKIL